MSDSFFEELEEEISFGRAAKAPSAPVKTPTPEVAPRREVFEPVLRTAPSVTPSVPTAAPVRAPETSTSTQHTASAAYGPMPGTKNTVSRRAHMAAREQQQPSQPQSSRPMPQAQTTHQSPPRQSRPRNTDAPARSSQISRPTSGLPVLPESRPVFLPNQERDATRCLLVSHIQDTPAPMWLYRYQSEVILIHSGIGTPHRDLPGARVVFPDFRLLTSIRERITGLFLPETAVESAEYYRYYLSYLGFPRVYARAGVRDLISASARAWGAPEGFSVEEFTPTVSAGSFTIHTVNVGGIAGVLVSTPSASILECSGRQVFDGTPLVDTPSVDMLLVSADILAKSDHPIFSAVSAREVGSFVEDRERDGDDDTDTEATPESGPIRLESGGMVDIVSGSAARKHAVELYLDTLILDGNAIGTASSHVLKARSQMRDAGVAVVIFTVDSRSRTILGPIRIETRGLAHLHEAREIHRLIIRIARGSYEETVMDIPDIEEKDLVKILRKDIEKALSSQVSRIPMIIPVIVTP